MKLPLQAAVLSSTFQRIDLEENRLTSLLISNDKYKGTFRPELTR
jgi:hypothetical protein